MKFKTLLFSVLTLAAALSISNVANAQITAFTYQGELSVGGSPATGSYDMTFALFTTNTGGVAIAGTITNYATLVSNGLFTTSLDFGAEVFSDGSGNWLEVSVQTNGGSGFSTLSPRQALAPVPSAIFANVAKAAGSVTGPISISQLPGSLVTNNGTGINLTGSFSGSGAGLTSLNASSVVNGIIPTNVLSGFQPPNYATVSGGLSNVATGQYSTAGGGLTNSVLGIYSTVGGGTGNSSSAYASTVGGGSYNGATNQYATVAGGGGNRATGAYASVSGGFGNTASGVESMIPGGFYCMANGYASFAAGYFAEAMHDDSFVWNDGSTGSFSSLAPSTFNVHASGGILLDGPIEASGPVVIGDDAQLGTGSGDYHHLGFGGGNSSGFIYGSYPALSDGIHMGYNYYYDAYGTGHTINNAGQTSRITAGYGFCQMAVGGIATGPNAVRVLANSSGVTVYGTFNNSSDRNAKQDFASVSAADILEKVAQLPVSEWSYKEDSKTRHIGPMGQDFYSTFNIGTDEKHIAPIDEGGVALAAIKGLNQKVEEQRVELKKRDSDIAELRQNVAELKQLVSELVQARPQP